MCVCVIHTVVQSCLSFCDTVDCGILQARNLEWVAISISRGSFWHRDQILVFLIWGRFLTFWATREVCLSKQSLFIFQLLVFCIYGLSFRYLIFWWDLGCHLGKLRCILSFNWIWNKIMDDQSFWKKIFFIIKKILSVIVSDRQQSSGSFRRETGKCGGIINGVRKLLGSVNMLILFILVVISYICYNIKVCNLCTIIP